MAQRILLVTGMTAAIIAGCSQTTEKPEMPSEPTPLQIQQVSAPMPLAADLLEVSASANVESTPQFRSIVLPPVKPQRRQVSFTIGGDSTTDEGTSQRTYTPGQADNLAPTYPERPIPATGTTKQEVLATIGTPPGKLPGTAGVEVWDYGTFRVLFKDDKVAFTNVW